MDSVISEEAVEAAARALYWNPVSNGAGTDAPEQWTACENAAREILAAAAPYMLAEAWDGGLEAGRAPRHVRVSTTNPYRS